MSQNGNKKFSIFATTHFVALSRVVCRESRATCRVGSTVLAHTNCTGYTKWPGNKSVMLKTSKFWLYLHFWCSHEQKKKFFFCGKIFVMSKKKIFFWATKRPGRPTMVVGRATVGRPKRPSRATKATWSGGQATMVGSEPCRWPIQNVQGTHKMTGK